MFNMNRALKSYELTVLPTDPDAAQVYIHWLAMFEGLFKLRRHNAVLLKLKLLWIGVCSSIFRHLKCIDILLIWQSETLPKGSWTVCSRRSETMFKLGMFLRPDLKWECLQKSSSTHENFWLKILLLLLLMPKHTGNVSWGMLYSLAAGNIRWRLLAKEDLTFQKPVDTAGMLVWIQKQWKRTLITQYKLRFKGASLPQAKHLIKIL